MCEIPTKFGLAFNHNIAVAVTPQSRDFRLWPYELKPYDFAPEALDPFMDTQIMQNYV